MRHGSALTYGEAGAEADRALGNVRTLKLFAAEDTALGRSPSFASARRRRQRGGRGVGLRAAELRPALAAVIDGTLTSISPPSSSTPPSLASTRSRRRARGASLRRLVPAAIPIVAACTG